MNGRRWVFLVWMVLWTMPSASVAAIEAAPLAPPPARFAIPDVPFFSNRDSHNGPASVAAVLSFWGKPVRPEDVAAPDPEGEPATGLEAAARARGLEAWTYRGGLADLRNHVSLGHPVIAYLDLGSQDAPDGEFVVVTGYNDEDRKIFAHSVEQADRRVGYDQFVEAWARADFWTLMILPKETRQHGDSPDDATDGRPR